MSSAAKRIRLKIPRKTHAVNITQPRLEAGHSGGITQYSESFDVIVDPQALECLFVVGQLPFGDAAKNFANIFNENISKSSDGNEMFETLSNLLSAKLKRIQPFESDYFGGFPTSSHLHRC